APLPRPPLCAQAAAHVPDAGCPGSYLAQRPQPIAPMAGCPTAPGGSFLVPPLDAWLPQQLAVLLLGHSLAALRAGGARDPTLARRSGPQQACLRPPGPRRLGTRQRLLHANGLGYRPSGAPSA